MDLRKRLIHTITDKASRDAARSLLRSSYPELDGAWAEVIAEAELRQGLPELNDSDLLELYDVETRGVAVAYPPAGSGHAWVWNGEWTYAPALAAKASIVGTRFSPRCFCEEFPDADLLTLEELARAALGLQPSDATVLLTPRARDIPDRS
jgi:hypothetical protein